MEEYNLDMDLYWLLDTFQHLMLQIKMLSYKLWNYMTTDVFK